MGCMAVRYNEVAKDYLHTHLHNFINHYRCGNSIDLLLYHGYNSIIIDTVVWRLNRDGTRNEIEYNLDYQCIIPTNKRYWKKPKDKYRRNIGHLYWTKHMTRTNLRHLFRNKGNFTYNHKLKNGNICLKLNLVVTLIIYNG